MLESLRRGQRWLTAIFVGVIGLVFAAFIGLGGPFQQGGGGGSAVVSLDDDRFGVSDFERIRQQQEDRYREALGDQFDSRTASDFIDRQSLGILVNSAILAHAAEELGFRVTKEEIQAAIREIPGFRGADGRFDQEAFIDQVEYTYGSQRAFLRVMREDLLKQKLGRLLAEQARVSEAEARDAARFQLEQIAIAYVSLDTESLPPGEELSDEDLQAYLEAHRAELQADYDARRSEFTTPERVRVRHLLIRSEDLADVEAVEAARQRAEAARTRILEGASFEDVAMEVSEDPGSREAGGDLGLVARGEISGALETAAFSQEEGVVGEVIQSEAGFHVVRVEGREAPGEQPFEDVALELARDGAVRERAGTLAREHVEALAAAVRDGESLEAAARARDLTLERTDLFRRRPDGFIPGLGASPELMATAFTLPEAGASSPRVFEVGPKRVMVQLLDKPAVDETALTETTRALLTQMREQRQNTLIQDWIDARRTQLMADQRLFVNYDLVSGR
ncbi:MAG: SurA N-terminal domain-containing protein [Myxococcota bacterium]